MFGRLLYFHNQQFANLILGPDKTQQQNEFHDFIKKDLIDKTYKRVGNGFNC